MHRTGSGVRRPRYEIVGERGWNLGDKFGISDCHIRTRYIAVRRSYESSGAA